LTDRATTARRRPFEIGGNALQTGPDEASAELLEARGTLHAQWWSEVGGRVRR
jgi:hypothetical protein